MQCNVVKKEDDKTLSVAARRVPAGELSRLSPTKNLRR